MRSGGCGLPQTLTAEAASVLKHSLGLARRRGHAQVTPLHVAATLLTLRSSSLRRACLKSQPHHHTTSPHPLQCRALELCFNVALNRLPTSAAPSLLHPHQPSLSNALVAALKRAQAQHRRGCIEQQQQPLLTTIKVELEQLIISILDDPSVSRVMREAGFSSTAVKSNLDDSSASSVFQCYNSSGGVFSSPCSPSPTGEIPYSFDCGNPVLFSPLKRAPVVFSRNYNEDIKLVLDILLRKKRKNTVIVGDTESVTEGLLGELMGRFERGEVPDELKSTRFVKSRFASSSLSFMKREQVEMSLSELERKVDSVASLGGGGVIVYIGDLKWTVEEANLSEKNKGYSPVEHLVAEIGKLFCDYGSSSKACNSKVWLMGTASYQTYMRCQMRQPPLETQWALQAVPVPSSSGLGLSLHASSVLDSKPFNDKEEQDKPTCCAECASNYEKEAQLFKPGQKKLLPSWLQSHSTEAHHKDELIQLRKKWNKLCHCHHQSKHSQSHWSNTLYSNPSSSAKIYPYSSSYSWWPNQGSNSITTDSSSICFADSIAKPSYSNSSNLVPRFRRQQSCAIEFNFCNETQKPKATEPSLDSLKGTEGKEVKITLALGNSSFGDSGQTVENITDHTTLLRRAHICKLLQENVPWQSETLLSSIAEAFFVDSKSAKQNSSCWLYMQGNDSTGKRRLARAIAESVFSSANLLLNLDMRKKETIVSPCSEMLSRALKTHERLVVLIENADFADAQFKKFLADGFETGKFGDFSAEEKPGQAIFILTNNGSAKEQSQDDSAVSLELQVIRETKPSLDHKRRAEWDLITKFKRPRIEEKEEVALVFEKGNFKKDFSRQSSFNTLDLNIRANEDDEDGEEKAGKSSPISSDLTRETNAFLDFIEKRFVLNRSPGRDKREMEAFFSSKIKRCFEEICGKQRLENFSIEERVVEEISVGCGSFTNSMFEKWLKDIFQSSLQAINLGGKEEGIVFKLCWGGKGDRILDSGFMSSCLPRNIQVNYFMD